ncbi:MAG: radical SAM protein [Candidatus Omnitrophica bacterium]|nr:radical SAM protein [Candidatus Omnitrophota bacterium]
MPTITDEFRIDSHKLMYHVPRVYQWLKGKNIYPIYIEIGLYGGCNHRCVFCAFGFFQYKPDILGETELRRFILEAAKRGVKSILYSGEGEPLLHKDAVGIINFTKKAGIDVALVTNGVLFDKEKAAGSLNSLSWLKVSLDAGTKKNYAAIHGTVKEDFDIVIKNLREAVKIRNQKNYSCVIGAQFLLIPKNYKEVLAAAKIVRDAGADYLVIKPYSRHPANRNTPALALRYRDLARLEGELKKYEKSNFKIILRRNASESLEKKKPYAHCLGLPFAAHITARGDMYPCNLFLGKQNFAFGNIGKESFKNIWEGEKRKKVMARIYAKWDLTGCRKACRLDEINGYLWGLKNPGSHVNFI